MVSQGSWRLKRKYHGTVWGSLLVVTFSVKAAKKGKASMGALMSAGTRPGGLNPICGASMWKSFGIPAMLYGCENVTATEKEILNRSSSFAAKRLQGVPTNSHSRSSWYDRNVDNNRIYRQNKTSIFRVSLSFLTCVSAQATIY